jgi:nucleoside-diphosphate-sugar epimerase
LNVLITGCSGAIGNYLSHYFLDKGWIVYGVSRKNVNICHKNFNLVHSSIDKGFFQLPQIDFCIHTAALPPDHDISTIDYVRNNVIGTSHVLGSVIESKCKKIVFLSGVSLYGNVFDKVIDEKTSIINPSIYGISKYLSECEIIEQTDVEYVILRLPGVLGVNAKVKPWLIKLIQNIVDGSDVDAYNKDELFNNAIDIYDLSIFIDMCLSSHQIKNKKFILGASNPMTIQEITDYIKAIANSKSTISFSNKGNSFTVDFSKAKAFGYNQLDLQNIIRRQIYFMQKSTNKVKLLKYKY